MPPKRRRDTPPAPAPPAAEQQSTAPPPAPTEATQSNASQDSDLLPASKRPKLTESAIIDDEAPATPAANPAAVDNEDEIDDGRPVCQYDERCYRRNPQHFKEYRHPKKKAMERNGGSAPKPPTTSKPQLQRTRSLSKVMTAADLNSVRPCFFLTIFIFILFYFYLFLFIFSPILNTFYKDCQT